MNKSGLCGMGLRLRAKLLSFILVKRAVNKCGHRHARLAVTVYVFSDFSVLARIEESVIILWQPM